MQRIIINQPAPFSQVKKKGSQIYFFIYDPDYHSSRNFYLKRPEYDGLLGLEATDSGIKIKPQFNVPYVNQRSYALFGSNRDRFSVHAIFSFMSMFKKPFDSDTLNFDNNLGSRSTNLVLPGYMYKCVGHIPTNNTGSTVGLFLCIDHNGVFHRNTPFF